MTDYRADDNIHTPSQHVNSRVHNEKKLGLHCSIDVGVADRVC